MEGQATVQQKGAKKHQGRCLSFRASSASRRYLNAVGPTVGPPALRHHQVQFRPDSGQHLEEALRSPIPLKALSWSERCESLSEAASSAYRWARASTQNEFIRRVIRGSQRGQDCSQWAVNTRAAPYMQRLRPEGEWYQNRQSFAVSSGLFCPLENTPFSKGSASFSVYTIESLPRIMMHMTKSRKRVRHPITFFRRRSKPRSMPRKFNSGRCHDYWLFSISGVCCRRLKILRASALKYFVSQRPRRTTSMITINAISPPTFFFFAHILLIQTCISEVNL